MNPTKSANTTFSSTDSTGVLVSALPSAVAGGGPIAEHAIAGLLLSDPDRTFRLCLEAKITPSHFVDLTARAVYRTVAKLHSDGHPLDSFAVVAGCGVDQSACEKLVDAAPIPEHAESYVSELVLAHGRRTLANTLCKAVDALNEPACTAEFVLSELLRSVDHVSQSDTLPQPVNALSWTETEPPEPEPVLVDVFDLGDKCAIIAASKMRKSFFLLQMSISLAAGQSFLKWRVAGKFRVLVIQLEIQERHYHRRMLRTWQAMGNPDIGDRLHVMNCRGCDSITEQQVVKVAKQIGAQVVCFDPLYKIMSAESGENSAEDMKPTLAMFDRIAQETEASVIYVHHDPKNSSERNIRDRGAGHSVQARDYDACITITEHRDNPDSAVIHTLLRNYPPQTEFTATWQDGRFIYDWEVAPVVGKAGKYDQAYRAYVKDNPGASLLAIAEAIGCDKSTASRLRSRLGVA